MDSWREPRPVPSRVHCKVPPALAAEGGVVVYVLTEEAKCVAAVLHGVEDVLVPHKVDELRRDDGAASGVGTLIVVSGGYSAR
eukprot:gene2005-biopygen8621